MTGYCSRLGRGVKSGRARRDGKRMTIRTKTSQIRWGLRSAARTSGNVGRKNRNSVQVRARLRSGQCRSKAELAEGSRNGPGTDSRQHGRQRRCQKCPQQIMSLCLISLRRLKKVDKLFLRDGMSRYLTDGVVEIPPTRFDTGSARATKSSSWELSAVSGLRTDSEQAKCLES